MNPLAQHIVAVTVMLAVAIPAGLFVPRLFAQEVPPQLGLGALHKVEIFNTDKCLASFIAFESSNQSTQVNIEVPQGDACDKADGADLAAAATAKLQADLDFCQPISGLPDEDPDKLTDPKVADPDRKDLYYDGFDLCSRTVVVNITWDGREYNLAWKSANTGRK